MLLVIMHISVIEKLLYDNDKWVIKYENMVQASSEESLLIPFHKSKSKYQSPFKQLSDC